MYTDRAPSNFCTARYGWVIWSKKFVTIISSFITVIISDDKKYIHQPFYYKSITTFCLESPKIVLEATKLH